MKPTVTKRAGEIDWERVRQRLTEAQSATASALQPSAERVREILTERARVLARPPADLASASEAIEVLTFALGSETYGIATAFVFEVQRLTEITPLPAVQPQLLGITNLRGQILAVFDLTRLFGLPATVADTSARLVVLGRERVEFGILAGAVYEVTRLRRDDILEPCGSVAGGARECLHGVTAEGLLVLNGNILLRDPRLFIAHTEASADAEPHS